MINNSKQIINFELILLLINVLLSISNWNAFKNKYEHKND